MNFNKYFFKYGVYYPVIFLKTKGFFSVKSRLFETQYWEPEKIVELQLEKARKLLEYAKSNIPIYKEKLSGIEPNSILTIKDFNRLPLLDKETVKNKQLDFMSGKIPLLCTRKTTGGSTGQAVTILKSRAAMAFELAATWRGCSWAGIDIGDRQVRFWGVPFSGVGKFFAKATDIVCNRKRVSAFSFSTDSLEIYNKLIETFQPDYYYGYVSMLVEYARYVARNEIRIPSKFNLKAIVVTSEVLHKSQKKLLEETFNVRVYNEYGCGEVGTIAHECEHGNMHISAENMIVEVLDGDRVCETEEPGEIVVTELNNNVFPLIRYRLGDFGALSGRICPCGRKLAIIDDVKGRSYDIIRSPDGKKFHGEFFMYIFEEAERRKYGVEKFQVKQSDLQTILVKIVPSDRYKREKLEQLVRTYVHDNIGEKIVVNFEQVKDISREYSGKMRLIVGMD